MLLFPLAPFFVLFCNVIATSNEKDFTMIKTITDDLHQFAEANASIGKLYKLFAKFLDLCAPLIKRNLERARSEQPAVAENVAGMSEEHNLETQDDAFGRAAAEAMVDLQSANATGVQSNAPRSEGWDDSLVWELFNNQPSLGWAESELWDAMAQFDG
jgi:hypothetical protein